nr:putative F-box protein At5g55150 [Tanacetum cinerariifolium]
MLPEVLDLIADKHITCYEDYPSFAGVCKSWRLAAARTHHNSNGPPSRFPSLMLAEKSDDNECCELFLLSNKSICKIRLPEIYGKERCSSCGWLLTAAEDELKAFDDEFSRYDRPDMFDIIEDLGIGREPFYHCSHYFSRENDHEHIMEEYKLCSLNAFRYVLVGTINSLIEKGDELTSKKKKRRVGVSANLRVGQKVFAIGNPNVAAGR